MKNKLVVGLFLIVFIFVTSPNNVAVASVWDGQAPNTMYENFADALKNKLISAEHSFLGVVSFYKKLTDTKAVFYEGFMMNGVSKKVTASSTVYDSKSSATYEYGTSKKTTSYSMNIVTKSGDIFVAFPDAKSRTVKDKWVTVPADKYEEFGQKMGLNTLFQVALIESGAPEEKIQEISVKLARKHNLYAHMNGEIDDDNFVEDATRYDLILNRDSVVPFYKELSQSLTKEEHDKTILAIDGFEKELSDHVFVDYLVDHSYTSLWIDNSTQLPTRLLQAITLPPSGKRKEVAVSLSDMSWNKPNDPVTIEKPSTALSLDIAAKAFKIKLGEKTDFSSSKIKDLHKKLTKEKTKSGKAFLNYLIAREYDAVNAAKDAAKFYMKAASYYTKGSVDYYEALAQAEWSLGNGLKVREYYELALKQDPENDLILNQYGWFLTGLSPASYKLQDLPKALILNTKLVSKVVDDSNLLNLYLTYTLLGKSDEAEALKIKFDNFATGNNYNIIARAYYRLNDKKNLSTYTRMAADVGYVRNEKDNIFFALLF